MENCVNCEDPKLVTLSCSDHNEKLVNGLWNSFQAGYGLDFDFQFGEQTIRIHRLIVEVFMLPRQSNLTAGIGQIDTETEGSKPTSSPQTSSRQLLEPVLEFLYKGRVTVGEDQLDDLLNFSKEMGFQMLMDAVETVKRHQTESLNEVNAESNLSLAQRRPRRVNPSLLAKKTGTLASRSVTTKRKYAAKRPPRKKVAACKKPKWQTTRRKQTPTNELKKVESCDEEEEHDDDDDDDDHSDGSFRPDSDDESGKSETSRSSGKKPAPNAASGLTGSKRKAGTRRTKSVPGNKDLPLFKCTFCPHETRNKTWLQIHLAKHDPSIAVFRCSSCSRQYLTESALQHHRTVAHAGDPEVFECPHCDYRARNKNWFQVHLAKHDPSVAKTVFRCDLCEKPFFSQESVERHKANHKIYKCPLCTYETPKAVSYYQHRFTVHEVDGKGQPLPRLSCSECKFTCKKRSELKYHSLAMHSGTKPFRCPQCPYVTGRKTQVNRHIKSAHLDVKPHLCHTCGRRCLTQSQLERHNRTHTGEKPFKCDVCSAAFAHRGSLVSHARLHAAHDRPFVCHVCGHSFNRKYHLKVHLKNVHKTPMDQSESTVAASVDSLPVDLFAPTYFTQ